MLAGRINDVLNFDVSGSSENLRWKKRRVLKALRDLFGMEVAFISRFGPGTRTFDEVDKDSSIGLSGITPGAFGSLAKSYCSRVNEGLIPNVIQDSRNLPEVQDIPETKAIPIGAHISVPIQLTSGRIYGMLCAFRREADHSLSSRDQALFTLCADLIARDIEAVGDHLEDAHIGRAE